MPMSTDIKISKTQIFKLIQSGGFLGSLLSKLAGPLMKVPVTLAKNILAPLGITAVASAIDAGIQKKIHGSGTKNLIIPNKKNKRHDANYSNPWRFNIFHERVTKKFENKTKKQKGGFLGMLLGTLGASLLGNMLARKGILRAGFGKVIVRAGSGKGIVWAGYRKEWDF